MQNQALSDKAKNDSNPHRSGKNIRVFTIIGLCFASMIGLYLLVEAPRYIILSIPPPEDSYSLIDWTRTTRAIVTTPGNRDYSWRQEATLAYDDPDNIPSWDVLSKYFEERLFQIGWKQSETSMPCDIELPEASFLKYGENGYVTYLRINDTDEMPIGDAICLAIWNDEGASNVFRIVLLTVKRSFIANLFQVFE